MTHLIKTTIAAAVLAVSLSGCATPSANQQAYDYSKVGTQIGETAKEADSVASSGRANATQHANFSGKTSKSIAEAAGMFVTQNDTANNLREGANILSQRWLENVADTDQLEP